MDSRYSRRRNTDLPIGNRFARPEESQNDLRDSLAAQEALHTRNQHDDFLRGHRHSQDDRYIPYGGDHNMLHGDQAMLYGDSSGVNPMLFDLLREQPYQKQSSQKRSFLGRLFRRESSSKDSIKEEMKWQKWDYEQKLRDVRRRKAEFEDPDNKTPIEDFNQSLTTSEGYSYERNALAYFNGMGVPTLEVTIKIKNNDSPPVEITSRYTGKDRLIAQDCCRKMDSFLQNNYHAPLAQEILDIKKEMAPRYAALGETPDADAKAALDTEQSDKIAAAEKKAGESLKKFLDRHGTRSLDAELWEELQWVQGMDAAARDVKKRVAGAEDKLRSYAEDLEKINTDINDKIQEIKQLLPASSEAAEEGHASSSEASHHSNDTLTLENFDQKIKGYMKDNGKRLLDPIYKQITSLATDESKYPEGMGQEDKAKIRKGLIDIAMQLIKREYKMGEPTELLEKWVRYTTSHYGKRLMYESQMIDHLEEVSKAAGEHATALHLENELIAEVDRLSKAGEGKANLHPATPDTPAAEFESTLARLQDDSLDDTQRAEHIRKLVDLYPQIQDTAQSNALQSSLERLERAHLHAAETKGKYDQAKALTDKIQKLIDLETGRDNADDGLDLKKVEAVKKTDEAALQHARALELEMVKHFYTRKLEEQKVLNKEEEELRNYLIGLDKAYMAHTIQQKRLITMYWLALFGAGDQAALVSLRTETSSEFNSLVGLFTK